MYTAMLRYKADRRTVCFLVMITSMLILQWNLSRFHWYLYAFQIFMTTNVFVIAHYHNHVPMWRNKLLNRLTDYWITIFYGFPTFVWTPTHNMNHHKFNNNPGDDTITYRYSEKNNLASILSYPSISSYFQMDLIRDYLKGLRKTRPDEFRHCITQIVVLGAVLAVAFLLDWKKALLYLFIPQQFALFVVLAINYIQHVHADEQSEYNHSRNFKGLFNSFFLNSGLHTAHHERMGLHWSKLPEAHAKIEQHIDKRLIEKSFAWYLFRVYILGLFFPSCRTQSMRLERIQSETSLPLAS